MGQLAGTSHDYSQLSANGHSRKRTALLIYTDTFFNSLFYLPVKLCIYTFP